jgi:antagonist of KipI
VAVPIAPDAAAGGADRVAGRPQPVTVLRVVAGPSAGLDALVAESWSVSMAADRVGIRLDGPPLQDGLGGETLTSGVPWGAVQVPPNGAPIILSVDHQTTGGYRVVAVVIAADLPLLGQLGPGMAVRLVAVGLEEADAAARQRETALDAVAAAIHDATRWDDLASSAGG